MAVILIMGPSILSFVWWVFAGNFLYKRAQKRLEKELDESGFVKNYIFYGAGWTVAVDIENGKIAMVSFWNPSVSYVLPADRITKTWVDDGKGGAGFMEGSPGQTLETLAADLEFLQELKPQMVGIGPFIPHHGTKFANEKAGSVSLTLFLLSVIRIMLPKVLLPATTALGTADSRGREKGLEAGANVVMPNLSPLRNRKQYDLYDNKICTGDEAAECRTCLARRVASVGYRLADERGDALE